MRKNKRIAIEGPEEMRFSHSETLFITGLKADTLLTWHRRDILRKEDWRHVDDDVMPEKYPKGLARAFTYPMGAVASIVEPWESGSPGRGNRRNYSLRTVLLLSALHVLTEMGLPVSDILPVAGAVSRSMEEYVRVRPETGTAGMWRLAIFRDQSAGPDDPIYSSEMLVGNPDLWWGRVMSADRPCVTIVDPGLLAERLLARVEQIQKRHALKKSAT
jgi:hypothetical protein